MFMSTLDPLFVENNSQKKHNMVDRDEGFFYRPLSMFDMTNVTKKMEENKLMTKRDGWILSRICYPFGN